MITKRNNENIIFLHIPKTGGTSVEAAFKEFDSKVDYYRHKNLDFILNTKNLKADDCFIFTIVRNVYDRIFSTYLHHKRIGFGKWMTFEEYVHNIEDYYKNPSNYKLLTPDGISTEDKFGIGGFLWKNEQKFAHYQHIMRFDYWCGMNDINYIMRFESLSEDYIFLKEKYNLGILPHTNKNPLRGNINIDYKKYYNDNMVKIIKNIYGEEIEKFKYKF